MLQALRTNIPASNHFALFLQANKHLISESHRKYIDYFHLQISLIKGFQNLFHIDGYSIQFLSEIMDMINDAKALNKEIVIPAEIDLNADTIIFNNMEGWGADVIFEGIHKLIDFFNFKGKIIYSNSSFNIEDVYLNFCKRKNITPKIQCCYNGSPSLMALSNGHYLLPKEIPAELPFEEKKLFCSFNWNSWEHRLAFTLLLHYYDLLKESYFTSPGILRFGNGTENDYYMYINGSKEYIDCYEDKEQIYNKASELQGKLPFTIDDRTKYTYPDEPLTIPENKTPIYNCRINSLIEVVMETKFFGEHMMTEKTFNPISLGKPFIVMSSANLLQSIRKIGFKTFSPYIDESYDKIEDNAARLRAIVNEIERIRKFRQDDPKGFKEWYKELQVIAQYNLELITLIGIKQGNHCDDYSRWIRFMHVGI